MNWTLVALLLASRIGSVAVEESVAAPNEWWRHAVCYEVFVRSFYDSNGDGIGDLKGLTSRLDYINDGKPRSARSLGANCIWLMPVAKSPSYHGYDVTDYYHVNPDYGTDADFRELVKEAHKRGIRVIVDFVPNHTSSEHPAFQAALRDTTSPYRDWYRWSSTKPKQPGTWGQEVWHKSPVRDEYYYGLFWGGMPDLNYEKPAALQEMEKVAAYWVHTMGVDGFRIDAASHLVEEGDALRNAPGTNVVLRKFAAALSSMSPRPFTVGEVWTDSAATLARYYPDQLDMYFAFTTADATLTAAKTGDARHLVNSLRELGRFPPGRLAPLLTNHDQPRVMTRLSGAVTKARIAAVALFSLPGTPFFYYGEEIGMSGDKPDPQIRTPMQWSSASYGGFTGGHPWEGLQPDWLTVNVEAESNKKTSLLNLYRTLIHTRLQHEGLASGDVAVVPTADSSLVALLRKSTREEILVVLNFSDRMLPRTTISLPQNHSIRTASRIFGDSVRATANGDAVTIDGIAPRQGYWFVVR